MEKIAEGEIKNCRTVQTRSVKKKREERELKNAAPGSHSIPEWVGGATSKIQLFQNSILFLEFVQREWCVNHTTKWCQKRRDYRT